MSVIQFLDLIKNEWYLWLGIGLSIGYVFDYTIKDFKQWIKEDEERMLKLRSKVREV